MSIKMASFSYKLWLVNITDYGGYQNISISFDIAEINKLLEEIIGEEVKSKTTSYDYSHFKPKKTTIVDTIVNQIIDKVTEYLFTIQKRYWFGDKFEKCKNDAVNYINNMLGNAIEYIINGNISPALKMLLF